MQSVAKTALPPVMFIRFRIVARIQALLKRLLRARHSRRLSGAVNKTALPQRATETLWPEWRRSRPKVLPRNVPPNPETPNVTEFPPIRENSALRLLTGIWRRF